MMNSFSWDVEGNAELPSLDFSLIAAWLSKVAASRNFLIGELNYIFCDDETIIRVNREFLDHDYFTDIITFDRTTRSMVRGDIYISLDTVRTNAFQLSVPYGTELLRVIAHGLLHLCGIDDKGPGEREVMERYENEALKMLAK